MILNKLALCGVQGRSFQPETKRIVTGPNDSGIQKFLHHFFLSQPFDIMGTYLYNLTLTNSWMFFKRIQYA